MTGQPRNGEFGDSGDFDEWRGRRFVPDQNKKMAPDVGRPDGAERRQIRAEPAAAQHSGKSRRSSRMRADSAPKKRNVEHTFEGPVIRTSPC
ncbi:hypothetical protein Q3A80_00910 [Burkholderia sp. SR8]|uniref:hypothetical protein n=1 Tax=Burkholderia sp. SR8 TaxID=3062277 RepID=UPI004064B024